MPCWCAAGADNSTKSRVLLLAEIPQDPRQLKSSPNSLGWVRAPRWESSCAVGMSVHQVPLESCLLQMLKVCRVSEQPSCGLQGDHSCDGCKRRAHPWCLLASTWGSSREMQMSWLGDSSAWGCKPKEQQLLKPRFGAVCTRTQTTPLARGTYWFCCLLGHITSGFGAGKPHTVCQFLSWLGKARQSVFSASSCRHGETVSILAGWVSSEGICIMRPYLYT